MAKHICFLWQVIRFPSNHSRPGPHEGSPQEGRYNGMLLAASDKAHLTLIVPRHRCHKSSIQSLLCWASLPLCIIKLSSRSRYAATWRATSKPLTPWPSHAGIVSFLRDPSFKISTEKCQGQILTLEALKKKKKTLARDQWESWLTCFPR